MTSTSTDPSPTGPGLCFSDRIRTAETVALAALPPGTLMTAAASAIAHEMTRRARAAAPGVPIIALVGPGNNGGDALLAAILLRERGFPAAAWLLEPDVAPPADARAVLQRAEDSGLPINRALSRAGEQSGTLSEAAISAAVARGALFIDGLFGLGLRRPLGGLARCWIDALNRSGAQVLAVDLPSGIDADSGSVVGGPRGVAMRCFQTISFIADKPGLRTGAALDHVGEVLIDALGLVVKDCDGEYFTGPTTESALPLRSANAHKGSHGSVRIVGGAPGMTGALWLAGLAAQRAGAGKVFVAALADDPSPPGLHPEIMRISADAPPQGLDALVLGCGLGRSPAALTALQRALAAPCPLVLDADALNLLAAGGLAIGRSDHPTLLTPHPLEAARLLGCDTTQIQQSRIESARELARRFGAFVVLKGAGSVCATPDGRWSIIGAGGPALATAGTGDVLAGVIGALLAQRLTPWSALRLACWAHGAAGDRWTRRHPGAIGLAASELPELIRQVLNQEPIG